MPEEVVQEVAQSGFSDTQLAQLQMLMNAAQSNGTAPAPQELSEEDLKAIEKEKADLAKAEEELKAQQAKEKEAEADAATRQKVQAVAGTASAIGGILCATGVLAPVGAVVAGVGAVVAAISAVATVKGAKDFFGVGTEDLTSEDKKKLDQYWDGLWKEYKSHGKAWQFFKGWSKGFLRSKIGGWNQLGSRMFGSDYRKGKPAMDYLQAKYKF